MPGVVSRDIGPEPKRIAGYGMNVALMLTDDADAGAARYTRAELVSAIEDITGGEGSDFDRLTRTGFAHLSGYESQIAVVSTQPQYIRLLANWRMAAVHWAMLEFIRGQLSRFIHHSYGSTVPLSRLRSSQERLRESRAMIELISSEAAPVAMCDDDFDRYVYGAVWRSWEEKPLANGTPVC